MGSLGWPEILMILVVALIIFGPRKLPELGKTIGQSLAQFRRASEDFKRTWEEEVEMEKRRIEAPPQPYEESVNAYNTEPTPADSDSSNYWSEPVNETNSESAEVVSSPEDSIEVVPTITPDNQAVPRQSKRDWM